MTVEDPSREEKLRALEALLAEMPGFGERWVILRRDSIAVTRAIVEMRAQLGAAEGRFADDDERRRLALEGIRLLAQAGAVEDTVIQKVQGELERGAEPAAAPAQPQAEEAIPATAPPSTETPTETPTAMEEAPTEHPPIAEADVETAAGLDEGTETEAERSAFDRQRVGKVFRAFLAEKNIKWGELVGALLIFGGSLSLLVTYWRSFDVAVKLLCFIGAATVFFAAGIYTRKRWRLPTTSATLLAVFLSLVPLVFFACDLLGVGWIFQASVFVVFTVMTWFVGRILFGSTATTFFIMYATNSVAILLFGRVQRAVPAESLLPSVTLLFLINTAFLALSALRRGRDDALRISRVFAILAAFQAALTIRAALAPAGETALVELAPLGSFVLLALLGAGQSLARSGKDSLETFGRLLAHCAGAAASALPAFTFSSASACLATSLLALAATTIAVWKKLSAARLLARSAAVPLAALYLSVSHLIASPAEAMPRYFLTDSTGILLVGFLGALLYVCGFALKRARGWDYAAGLFVAALGAAIVSSLCAFREAPERVAWLWDLFGVALLAGGLGSRRNGLTRAGAVLATLAAAAHVYNAGVALAPENAFRFLFPMTVVAAGLVGAVRLAGLLTRSERLAHGAASLADVAGAELVLVGGALTAALLIPPFPEPSLRVAFLSLGVTVGLSLLFPRKAPRVFYGVIIFVELAFLAAVKARAGELWEAATVPAAGTAVLSLALLAAALVVRVCRRTWASSGWLRALTVCATCLPAVTLIFTFFRMQVDGWTCALLLASALSYFAGAAIFPVHGTIHVGAALTAAGVLAGYWALSPAEFPELPDRARLVLVVTGLVECAIACGMGRLGSRKAAGHLAVSGLVTGAGLWLLLCTEGRLIEKGVDLAIVAAAFVFASGALRGAVLHGANLCFTGATALIVAHYHGVTGESLRGTYQLAAAVLSAGMFACGEALRGKNVPHLEPGARPSAGGVFGVWSKGLLFLAALGVLGAVALEAAFGWGAAREGMTAAAARMLTIGGAVTVVVAILHHVISRWSSASPLVVLVGYGLALHLAMRWHPESLKRVLLWLSLGYGLVIRLTLAFIWQFGARRKNIGMRTACAAPLVVAAAAGLALLDQSGTWIVFLLLAALLAGIAGTRDSQLHVVGAALCELIAVAAILLSLPVQANRWWGTWIFAAAVIANAHAMIQLELTLAGRSLLSQTQRALRYSAIVLALSVPVLGGLLFTMLEEVTIATAAAGTALLAAGSAFFFRRARTMRHPAVVYLGEIFIGGALAWFGVSLSRLIPHSLFIRVWPIVVQGAALGLLVSAVRLQRAKMGLYATPTLQAALIVPLLPAHLMLSMDASASVTALAGAGALYTIFYVLRRHGAAGILALVTLNLALLRYLAWQDFSFARHPQIYMIPIGASLILTSILERRRVAAKARMMLETLGAMIILASSAADMFIEGAFGVTAIVLAALSVATVLLGMAVRMRAVLLLGFVFLLLDIVTQVFWAGRNRTWVWWISVAVLGVAIFAMFAFFEKKRRSVLDYFERFRESEDEDGSDAP